jgi:hypothetical protein
MTKTILLAGLAILLASPCFAQSYTAGFGTGNVLAPPGATNNAASAFAREPSRLRAYSGSRSYHDRSYKHHRHNKHHHYRHWSEF